MTDFDSIRAGLESKGRCFYEREHVDGSGNNTTIILQSPVSAEVYMLYANVCKDMSEGRQTPELLKLLNSCLVTPTNKVAFKKLCDEDYDLPVNLLVELIGVTNEQQARLEEARKKA